MWGTGTGRLRTVVSLAVAAALATLGVVGAAAPGASGAAVHKTAGGTARAGMRR